MSNENSENSAKVGTPALEGIAEIFKVLADPRRLALLQELKFGKKTVIDMVESLGMVQPSVSKHLKVLADADLVGRRKDGVKVFYILKGELMTPLCCLVCEKLMKDKEQEELVDYSI